MSKTVRYCTRFFQYIITALLVVFIIGNGYFFIMDRVLNNEDTSVFGYSLAIVTSGSMEPTIGIDDLIIIHDEESYDIGDIITFNNHGSSVTHRIIDHNENGFVTKGDANNAADLDTVAIKDISGKVVLVLPVIGKFVMFLKTPLGMMILMFIGVILILYPFYQRQETLDKEGGM